MFGFPPVYCFAAHLYVRTWASSQAAFANPPPPPRLPAALHPPTPARIKRANKKIPPPPPHSPVATIASMVNSSLMQGWAVEQWIMFTPSKHLLFKRRNVSTNGPRSRSCLNCFATFKAPTGLNKEMFEHLYSELYHTLTSPSTLLKQRPTRKPVKMRHPTQPSPPLQKEILT